MDVQVEQTSELVRTFTVTVPAERVMGDIDKQLKRIRKTHRQRGFRPGKVPMRIIRSKFGGSVRADVAERLIRSTLDEVLESYEDVVHITSPQLTSSDFRQEGLVYQFDAERLPEVEPKNYVGIEIGRPPVAVDDEEVQAQLEAIQAENTFNQPVDKEAVEDGDIVEVAYRYLKLDGEEAEGEDAQWHDATFEVGSDSMLPEFHDAVLGAATEQTVAFDFTMQGDDDVERHADVELEVKTIMENVVPEIDDELARDDGRAETLEELTAIVREELEQEMADKADAIAEQALTDKLLEFNPVALPPGYFELQLQREVEARVRQMFGGADLSQLGLDTNRLKDMWRESVDKGIRRVLILEAIADEEEIAVEDEEIDARIEEIADSQQGAAAAAQVRRFYIQAERREGLSREIRIDKTQDWVLERAEVSEIEWPEEDEGHDHEHSHDHGDDDHGHEHSHDHGDEDHDHDHGVEDHEHSHDHGDEDHSHDHGGDDEDEGDDADDADADGDSLDEGDDDSAAEAEGDDD